MQDPIRLDDLSEPEPDLAVLRYRDDFYSESHPTPKDVLVLIEVSDISLEYDRTVKLPLCARHGIPEVWMTDLASRAIEVYTEPSGGRYSSLSTKRTNDRVEPVTVSNLTVVVSDVV